MSEVTITDEIRVEAPIAAVWVAIEDPVEQARWHPFVTEIAGEHELGQLRTCSVLVDGKQGLTRERCVERESRRRITWAVEEDSTGFARMASGWRAGFTLSEHDGATIVTAQSSFRPRNLLVRAMLPMIRRKFHHTQRAILHGLKESLESHRSGANSVSSTVDHGLAVERAEAILDLRGVTRHLKRPARAPASSPYAPGS